MKKLLFMAMALVCGSAFAFAADLTAGKPIKVAQSTNGLMAPVWSPDGNQIAATGPNYCGIYVFKADGTTGQCLTTAQGVGYKMAWNAEGTEVVGRTNVRDGVRVLHEIKAYNATTGEARTIVPRKRTNANPRALNSGVALLTLMTEDAAGVAAATPALSEYAGRTVINPVLSPDGSKIAFQIVGKGMFVINADATDLRSLGTGTHPSWMPDSKTIVYTILNDDGQRYTSSKVMTVNIDSNTKAELFNDAAFIPKTPVVSPDGKRIAFENVVDAAIYVVNLK